MTDLEQAGLIGSEEERKQAEMGKDEFLERIDQALAGFMFAVQTLTERVGRCELYLSYLLQKDPTLADKIKAIADAAQTGVEANEGKDK